MVNPNQIKFIEDISSNYFGYFGENSFKNECVTRGMCFNKELYRMQVKQIFQLFNIKLKKSNFELNFNFNVKNKNKNKEKEIKEKEKDKDNKIDDNKLSKRENQEEKENEGKKKK